MSIVWINIGAACGAFAVACSLAGAVTWLAWRPPRVRDRDERAFRACCKALAMDDESQRTLRDMAEALRATRTDVTPVALILSRGAFIDAARALRARRGWRDDARVERVARALHERAGARNEKRPVRTGARAAVV